MIFLSDIDSTIIFSLRYLKDFPSSIPLFKADWKNDKPIGFMTEKSVDLFNFIIKNITFVPVTTRSIELYKRIELFQKIPSPSYAITSNGGNILINGEIDMEWQRCVEEKMKHMSVDTSEMIEAFNTISNPSWVRYYRLCDNLFWTVLTKREMIPPDVFDVFFKWADKNRWNVYIHNNKMYIVPECVNKRAAVEYLSEKIGLKKIISAGDSLMDYEFLKISSLAYVPSHGEIKKYVDSGHIKNGDLKFTENKGLMAGEEILENLYNYVKEHV